jgi:galactoside O-acetyltransferase
MLILARELKEWFDAIVFALPGGLGRALRGALYGALMQSCGPGLRIGLGGAIAGTAAMQIGAHCYFGRCNTILAGGGALTIGDRLRTNGSVTINASVAGSIQIGDDVLIGPNVVIRSASHRFDEPGRLIGAQGHSGGRIQIGSDVWLAANVVVLPNVTIGAGAVVAAGAVVTRDVPPLAVVAGVPARQIGLRGDRRPM